MEELNGKELKKELKEYRKILLELKGIEEVITNIYGISPISFNEIRTHTITSQVESKVYKLLKLEREYERTKERLVERLELVESYINQIEDSIVREIFRRRYILGYRWEKISSYVYMSEQHCRKLHDDELKNKKRLDN